MSMWPNMVRMGTIKMPLAMPSMPPSALAPSDTAKSHKREPRFQRACAPSVGAFGVRRREARNELDLVAAVVQLFIVDRTVFVAIRGSLDQENRAARLDLEGPRNSSSAAMASSRYSASISGMAYFSRAAKRSVPPPDRCR